jgi:hypothetical protein
MTPLGKALKDSIVDLNIQGELKDRILKKFEDAVDAEFKKLGPDDITKTKMVNKNKLHGVCKTYNNFCNVWNFQIENFNVTLDNQHINDQSCKLLTIAHGDF